MIGVAPGASASLPDTPSNGAAVVGEPDPRSDVEALGARLGHAVGDELHALRPRLLALNAALAALPDYALCRVRSSLLRLAGFRIGRATAFFGAPRLSGDGDIFGRLVIGRNCAINIGVVLELGAVITIGDRVSIGHEVMILTTSHKLGPEWHRAGTHDRLPVTIGNGAWLCARSTILPGVTVGAGAVVSAGSIVNKNVPPNSVVSGVPARVIVPKMR